VDLQRSEAASSFEMFWQRLRPHDVGIWRALCSQYLVNGVLPEPLVKGEDLIASGVKPGAGFKERLDRIYLRQLENPSLPSADLIKTFQ
jgi:hypothetical protein